MGSRKRKNIELYKSLEDLSIYRFDKVINGDLRYLSKEENVTHIKISEVYESVWSKLLDEYSVKTKNNSTVRIYLLLSEINYLSIRAITVSSLVENVLTSTHEHIVDLSIKEIEKWGFSINIEINLREQLNKILLVLKNSSTKIKRKTAEYKELTRGSEESLSLIQQKVKLERILGFTIDIKKTNVLEWLSYWHEVKLITRKKERVAQNG